MKTFIKFMALYTIWFGDMVYHLNTNKELQNDHVFVTVINVAIILWWWGVIALVCYGWHNIGPDPYDNGPCC